MKLQFGPNQTFQLDAVAAITDLFDGQPQGTPEHAVINVGAWNGLFAGQERTELGAGNRLLLATDKLLANTRAIQTCNDIEVADPVAPLEAWELFDGPTNQARLCPHFSVEMETGTGKTYVYLRTIFELSRCYSFQKFIIVVPSLAIREGVLKNIEITAEHFRALYNNLPFEHFVYDARKANRLRSSPPVTRCRSWSSTSMPSARILLAPRQGWERKGTRFPLPSGVREGSYTAYYFVSIGDHPCT
jgi:type III restriction enzyme